MSVRLQADHQNQAQPLHEDQSRERITPDVQKANETVAEVATKSKVFTPQEHGTQRSGPGYGTSVSSFINSRAVMRGASIDWNAERLIQGKLKQYQTIGGQPLTLTSQTGDKISAFHFDVQNFHSEIASMGGKLASLELHIDHPFFETGEPVTLSKAGTTNNAPGMRIPYSSALESEFKNPKEFIEFCNKMNYSLFWEDSLQPFETASWYHFNSMKQNLILVSNFDAKTLGSMSPASSIEIKNDEDARNRFTFFNDKPLTANGIVFENNLDDIEELLTAGSGLKIENSSWNMIRHNGKLYLLDNDKFETALSQSEMRKVDQMSSFRLKENPVREPNIEAERATVVLSMNQTNTFSSYSHEVLTFLFSGVNVLAYDNAGKGLSTGSNSEEGMTDAIRSAGQYLIEEKGLNQNQIIFKGQCAGGLPTSEAGKIFPASHVWVDQAPQTFSGAAKGIVLRKGEEISQSQDESWLKTFSGLVPFLAPIVSGASSLVLPGYDVVENLNHNYGIQIYTIGVLDSRGYGGDTMVPLHERDEIEKSVRLNPMGRYLEIKGGTHVTDWWLDPTVAQSVHSLFERFQLSADVFPAAPKTAQEAVSRRFENFFNKKFDPSSATLVEKRVHSIYEAVANENLEHISYIMDHCDQITPWQPMGLADDISYQARTYIINDAIDLSRELGQKIFTQKLLLAKKGGTI